MYTYLRMTLMGNFIYTYIQIYALNKTKTKKKIQKKKIQNKKKTLLLKIK